MESESYPKWFGEKLSSAARDGMNRVMRAIGCPQLPNHHPKISFRTPQFDTDETTSAGGGFARIEMYSGLNLWMIEEGLLYRTVGFTHGHQARVIGKL